jgi:hypothetical protein
MAGPYASTQLENYVGMVKQASLGTGLAPTRWAAFLPSPNLAHNQQLNRLMEAGAAGQPTYTEKTSHLPTGSFIVAARPSIAGFLAAVHLGLDTIGAPVSAVYPHVCTESEATVYLTVEQNLADAAIERFLDCIVSKLTFDSDVSAPVVRMTAEWAAAGIPAYQASATAESYESAEPFKLSDFTFTIDGDATQKVRKFQFASSFGVDVMQVSKVTGVYAVKVSQELDISVDTVLISTDNEYRKTQYGAAGNSAPLQTATSGSFVADATYGSAGTARELKLEALNVDWDDATYTALGTAEGTKVTRTGKGRKVAGSPMARITVNNADSTAYAP